jgi:hypothetical protein
VIAGEVVDLIADIPPAAEIIRRMVTQAEGLLTGASNRLPHLVKGSMNSQWALRLITSEPPPNVSRLPG